jgi:hypothetical protein
MADKKIPDGQMLLLNPQQHFSIPKLIPKTSGVIKIGKSGYGNESRKLSGHLPAHRPVR